MVDQLWLHLLAGSQAQLEVQIAARKAAREAEERAEKEEDERAERRAAEERQKMEEDFQRQQLQIQHLRSPAPPPSHLPSQQQQQPPRRHQPPPPLFEGGSEIKTSSLVGSVAGAPPQSNGDAGANALGRAVERVVHAGRPVHELPRTPDVSVLFRADRLRELF